MLAAINWNLPPEIFKTPEFWIFGSIEVRWYGLLFAASFYFGYMIFKKIYENEDISIELLDKLVAYVAVGTILGARLGHCLFYEPSYYLSHPLEIIKIWRGGLASHGAAAGILIGLWYYAKKTRREYIWILDRIGIVVALSGFFIRTGNLMNSEIYGVATTLPWGFVFLQNGETVAKHPTQIYEALSYLAIFAVLFKMYWNKKGQVQKGLLFGIFLTALFSMRFLIEFIKNDQVGFEQGMSLNMGQILSLPLIAWGVYLLYKSKSSGAYAFKPKK